MRNPFAKLLKEYFKYSKKDRNVIIIFIILISVGIITNEIIKRLPVKSNYDYSKFAKEIEELEKNQISNTRTPKKLFEFNPNTISEQKLDSLLLPDFVKRNLISYRMAGGKFSDHNDLIKLYGMNDSILLEIKPYIIIPEGEKLHSQNITYDEHEPMGTFDPNTADVKTLLYFGLNTYQAENIVRYREMGGEFRRFSDLLKIYGVDTFKLNKIRDHIIFEKSELIEYGKKDIEPVIELNGADSAQLTQLNGIGPAFALRILKYRDLLGGFYSSSQLLEVYNFPEETYDKIKNNIKVDSMQVKTLRINFAQYSELINHPYLNNKLVNSILTYRDINGAFKDKSQLENIPGIDTAIVRRISPYISFR